MRKKQQYKLFLVQTEQLEKTISKHQIHPEHASMNIKIWSAWYMNGVNACYGQV